MTPGVLLVAVILFTGKVERKVTWDAHLRQKANALTLFLFAGFLGLIVLGAPGLTTYNWYPIPQLNISPNTALLFPLFTGLFGLSTLSLSLIDTPHNTRAANRGCEDKPQMVEKTEGHSIGYICRGSRGMVPGSHQRPGRSY